MDPACATYFTSTGPNSNGRGGEGVDLLKSALMKNRLDFLFALDKLMSELVSPPTPTNDGSAPPESSPESRVITLQSLNSFDRKLVHVMGERYGLKTESHPGIIIRFVLQCACCYDQIQFKRVVIKWTPTAKQPSELIGDMYFALKGKRSQLDTSDRKGNYRYANHFYKPVWEKRRLQTNIIDAGKEAEGSLVTPFNTGFPVELLLAIFAFLPCRDLVCAGLVCKSWNSASLDPQLWRALCVAKLCPEGEKRGCRRKTKSERQKDKATYEQMSDQQQWRQCYVAHFWQWMDLPGDRKGIHHRRPQLQHSHSFLGDDICPQPHL